MKDSTVALEASELKKEVEQPQQTVEVLHQFRFFCCISLEPEPRKNLSDEEPALRRPEMMKEPEHSGSVKLSSKDYEKKKVELLKIQDEELKELQKEMNEIEQINTDKEQRMKVRQANEIMNQELIKTHELQLKELVDIIQKLKETEHDQKIALKRQRKSLRGKDDRKEIEKALEIQSNITRSEFSTPPPIESTPPSPVPDAKLLQLQKTHVSELHQLDIRLKEIEQGSDQSLQIYLDFDLQKRKLEKKQLQELEEHKRRSTDGKRVSFNLTNQEEIEELLEDVEIVAPCAPLRKKKQLRYRDLQLEHAQFEQYIQAGDVETSESETNTALTCSKELQLMLIQDKAEEQRKLKEETRQRKIRELKQKQEQELKLLEQQVERQHKRKEEEQRAAHQLQLQQRQKANDSETETKTQKLSFSTASPGRQVQEAATDIAESLTINVIDNTNLRRRRPWSFRLPRRTSIKNWKISSKILAISWYVLANHFVVCWKAAHETAINQLQIFNFIQ